MDMGVNIVMHKTTEYIYAESLGTAIPSIDSKYENNMGALSSPETTWVVRNQNIITKRTYFW